MPHAFTGPLLVESSPASSVSDDFLDRLLTFYWRQAPSASHLSPIWKSTYDIIMPELVAALDKRDKPALGRQLNNLYWGKQLIGMDVCLEDSEVKGLDFAKTEFDAELMLTAVAAGAIPANCPCQDNPKQFTREKVVADIEMELGLKLSHPGGARMPGARVGDRFMPVKMVEAVRTVAIVKRLLKTTAALVAEIGGGTGFTAYLLAAGGAMVTLIDLPPVAVIQAFLLSLAFGEHSIWFAGELIRYDAKIYVQGLNTPHMDCRFVINQNSMPEMPLADVMRYLKWIESSLDDKGMFLSINQESGRGGQVWVHEIAAKHTDLRPRYRAPHLHRHEGWMQEVYVKT